MAGQLVMAFKSAFTNEYSTVRDVMAPGPLREAAGFHYQEFTNLVDSSCSRLTLYDIGDQNKGSVWQEFLVPDTAEVVASFDDPYWHFPAITRNKLWQRHPDLRGDFCDRHTAARSPFANVLKRVGLTGPDQNLPEAVRVRHGRNSHGKVLHYYLNFSGKEQTVSYPYGNGTDLLTSKLGFTGQRAQAQSVGPRDCRGSIKQIRGLVTLGDAPTFGEFQNERFAAMRS